MANLVEARTIVCDCPCKFSEEAMEAAISHLIFWSVSGLKTCIEERRLGIFGGVGFLGILARSKLSGTNR